MGVIDANFGQVFRGDGKGNFTYVKQSDSGLTVTGDVKSMNVISTDNRQYLLIGINNVGIDCYEFKR